MDGSSLASLPWELDRYRSLSRLSGSSSSDFFRGRPGPGRRDRTKLGIDGVTGSQAGAFPEARGRQVFWAASLTRHVVRSVRIAAMSIPRSAVARRCLLVLAM